jgi:hypothetical protein
VFIRVLARQEGRNHLDIYGATYSAISYLSLHLWPHVSSSSGLQKLTRKN